MTLQQGIIGKRYHVRGTRLPPRLEDRLHALGMTPGCPLTLLCITRRGAVLIRLRGGRFALGGALSSRILVEEVRP